VTLPILTSQPPDPAAGIHGPYLPDSWPSLTAFAVAGMALIAIVRTVSRGPLDAPIATGRREISAVE
jgi:hypothetical protein